jgi:hypothetical protein
MKYGENQSLITKMQMEKFGSVKTKHTICWRSYLIHNLKIRSYDILWVELSI